MAVTDPKPSTAVVVVAPMAPIAVSLDAWPEDRFNRLVPTQTIGLGSDLIRPIVQAVVLDPERDSYESPDLPRGHRALTKRAIDALMSTAGVDVIEERRVDDGSNPDVCGVQVVAEMLLPTGRRLRTTGTSWADLNRMSWSSPAQRSKYRSKLYEHTSSRARNRAGRSLLSLRQSYTAAELRKPWAVVAFVPNMDHPDIRQAVIAAMVPAIAASFGPEARQLGPGPVVEIPEAPEDDVIEGQAVATDAASTASTADDEPPHIVDAGQSWDVFGGSEAPAAAAAEPTIVAVLRTKAEKSGLAGEITDPQKQQLAQRLLAPLGVDLVAAGLARVWGIERKDGKLIVTAAQAQALIDTAASDDFIDTWREAFGSEVAA